MSLDECSRRWMQAEGSASRRTTSGLNVSLNPLNVTLTNDLDVLRFQFRLFELRSFDWIDSLMRTWIARTRMLD